MKYRLRIIAVTVALLLLAPISLLCWGFCLPAQYEESFLGELKYKCQRLEETEGPRIILIGGSSLAFGVDSALLERALPGYQVVNFGLYAGLGTAVMLDLSRDSIRPGDIVLVLPEQQALTLSADCGGEYLWQGLDGAFGLLSRVTSDHWGQLAGQFPAFAASKLSYFLQGTPPQPSGIYARVSFNEYGDIVSSLCAANLLPQGYDPNTPISFQTSLPTAGFFQALNDYTDVLTQRGATVYYHFCPMNALAVEDGADVDGYAAFLREQLHCPLLGAPGDCLLEAGWFYDTNFHLNSSGKTVFTRQLARDLKAALGDSSPTEIALPALPALEAAAPVADTPDPDEDCFQYAALEQGFEITGLTPLGQGRASLTLPASHAGQPVRSLAASAFAGNTSIRSVTIPASFTMLADGAFDGCSQLETITLEHTDPAACPVGQGLLEGTGAVVLVSPEALSDFRLNYFWSVYGGRVQSWAADEAP